MMQARRRLPVLLAASLTTLGCASTPRAPDTGVERERERAPAVGESPRPPATSPVRATFEYAPGTASYVVTSEATIAEIDSAAASAPRALREVARVEITIAPVGTYRIVTTTGSIDATAYASIIQPFVDTLRTGGVDSIAEPRMPICGRDTVPPMHLVTLLPPVPAELSEGLRWQRRQLYATCQGAIPVRVERTESYTVKGRAPRVAGSGVTLSRSSSFAYAGAGVEGQHNVRIAGVGSAQATLILDASAGRLLSIVEESGSEINITASGRTRRFSQQAVRRVEAR